MQAAAKALQRFLAGDRKLEQQLARDDKHTSDPEPGELGRGATPPEGAQSPQGAPQEARRGGRHEGSVE